MCFLTNHYDSFLEITELPHNNYEAVKQSVLQNAKSVKIFYILDEVRKIILNSRGGRNILRYLLLRMNNKMIKSQYDSRGCFKLSDLKLNFGCIPFDHMPFCTSLRGHNPRFFDIIESISPLGREHETLARKIKANIERNGILYTPLNDLQSFGDVARLIATYNSKLYTTHGHRKLMVDKGHVFESGYEEEVVSIVEKLQGVANNGIAGYSQSVEKWLQQRAGQIDDPLKEEALKSLFTQSRVAVIYGAAGTGKSTMVQHIAEYFNDKKKLFVAHTNPAIDNLKRRVNAQNSEFRTIRKQAMLVHMNPSNY
tara:strand:+ start:310 stop:1242 length:933 start_codon:yes stop_codon:yes gene_type:complete